MSRWASAYETPSISALEQQHAATWTTPCENHSASVMHAMHKIANTEAHLCRLEVVQQGQWQNLGQSGNHNHDKGQNLRAWAS